ncbi:MAG: insulinase family protein [Deltaproteobacteria bacterium]|nr:insulinase family protein [Nannocystaceae bacterium]
MTPAVRKLLLALSISPALVGCRGKRDTERPDLPQPSRDLQIPGNGFYKQFDNGLELFIVPDAYTRLVQFDVRQQVGSREDPPGKDGMAHFVEHLMFQMPVEGPGTTRVMSDLPQHTLFFNAYTAADQTHYMHTGTSDKLERYMKYSALRLGYDCSAVEEAQFMRERDVVRNEHRWRSQGLDVFVFDEISRLAFPEGHPYRRSMLGADTELASITPEDTCEFIKRYYTASQASVVITGDVDPAAALELAKKYLEPLPKIEVPERKNVPPARFTVKQAEIKAPVKKPTAVIVYRLPKRFTPDYAASQASIETMLLSVFFFVQSKGEHERAVNNFFFVPLGGEEAQLFGIAVETKKARDLDRAIDEVQDAITRGFASKLEGEEYKGTYDSARNRARLGVLDGVSAIIGRSDAYASYLEGAAMQGFVGAEIAALDNLTSEHAQEVGRKLFARDEAMVVKVVPDGKEKKAERADFDYKPNEDENLSVPDDIDPAEAERPLALEDIAPPEGQSVELTLDNGMRVLLVQSSDMPVMDVQVIIGAGTRDAEQADIANMTARFFGAGDSLEARNIMSFFDLAGGIFDADVGPYATTYSSRGLSIYLDFIIAGLSEQLVQAEYGTGALERWKASRKDQLKKKGERQSAERTNAFYTALYGAGHPHVQEVITDKSKLKSISLRDVEEFRAKHYRASNSIIIVTGGFDMELATQYIEAFFGKPVLRDTGTSWMKPKLTAVRKPPPEPKPSSIRAFTEVDKERSQTDVTMAFPLAQAYGDDHAALAVMADMMNFGVSAVRMQLGASYGVYARLDTERPRIEVGGSLDSTRAGEAHKAILASIQRMRDGEDFAKQFAFARRNVLRQMINAQADPRLLAGQLAQAARAGRSYEYFQELARRVANLKPEQVKAQIDRVLVPGRSVTLIQGPAAGIANVVESTGIKGAKVLPEAVHDDDE